MQTDNNQVKRPKAAKLDKNKWSLLIEEWQQSGESQKRFCERLGLNINSFSYMKGKSKTREKINRLKTFIPVISVSESNTSLGGAIIVEKNGIKLHLPLSLPTDQFKHLLILLGWTHA